MELGERIDAIPIRVGAKNLPQVAPISENSNTAIQERDRHIRAIERHGRREWYKLSGFPSEACRSIATKRS